MSEVAAFELPDSFSLRGAVESDGSVLLWARNQPYLLLYQDGMLRLRRWVEEALFLPDFYPPVTQIISGKDGTIWLQREQSDPGDVSRWLVLDQDGDIEATVEIPAGVQVMAADRQRVWGVYHDELDVLYLVRYRIRR